MPDLSPVEAMERLRCADVPYGECCTSCHEDVELGYEMVELEDATTHKYRGSICCAKFNALPAGWLEERNLR